MEDLKLAEEVLGDLRQGRLAPWPVLGLLLARVFGYCVMLAVAFTKVPQIVKILRSKSVEGLNVTSFEMEMAVSLLNGCYSYIHKLPLSKYWESIVLFLESVILNTAIYTYAGTNNVRPTFIYIVIGYGLAWVWKGRVTAGQIDYVYDYTQVILATARVSQIWKNTKQRSSGQLSSVTYALFTLGDLMRIWTSVRDGADDGTIGGLFVGLSLNVVLFIQILVYSRKPKKTDTAEKED